jgi:hypothetical protein
VRRKLTVLASVALLAVAGTLGFAVSSTARTAPLDEITQTSSTDEGPPPEVPDTSPVPTVSEDELNEVLSAGPSPLLADSDPDCCDGAPDTPPPGGG